jgi:hypothetical protein
MPFVPALHRSASATELAMADNRQPPEYKAFPLKENYGWYVAVTPKHGGTHEVHGFVSETEARDWIRKELNAEYGRALRLWWTH